jgi:stalled ribosome rescue protein Dom34
MSDDATLSLVFEVMKAHGVADRADDELVQEAYAVVEDLTERLDEARDAYDDEDVQRDALLRVVEEILLEDGMVDGPPEFLEE